VWLCARDKAGRVLALPHQIPRLIERCGLTRADVDRAVWLIGPDGKKWSGAAAINRALMELGGRWRWLAALYRVAPLRWMEDRIYRWVAEHRSLLSRWWSAPTVAKSLLSPLDAFPRHTCRKSKHECDSQDRR
jgi:predicted DCC family thiol-disulfide oxidoreductase YuxK